MARDHDSNSPPAGAGSAWGRRSLRRRILLWMLWVALLPLVLMAVQGYHCAREAVIESARDRLFGIASSRGEWVNSWIQERLTDMEVIGHSRDCVALVRNRESVAHDRICGYLEVFRRRTGAYDAIQLFSSEWEPVAGAGGSAVMSPIEGNDRIRPLAPDTPELRLFLARPTDEGGGRLILLSLLRDDDETEVGRVQAEVAIADTLEPILHDRAGLGETGRAYLIDRNGEVLTSSGVERPFPRGPIDTEAARAVGEGESGTGIYRDPDGVDVVGGYVWMEEPGWGLIVEIDAAEALGWLRILKARAVVVGILALVLILLLSTRVSRLIATPMRQLSDAARRIAAGGEREQVEITGTVEAEEVGNALNRMLESLEEAQQRRIQSESLAAVGQVSSSIAHEIRNPLSSVKMNLQSLARKVADSPTDAELAAIGLDQVLSMEKLLEDLLSYAKPMTLRRDAVDVASVLEATASAVRAEAKERSVDVEWRDDTGGRRADLDPDRVRQVLTNLVLNGIQAAGSGGRVSCRSRWAADDEGLLRFVVEDTGPGIAEATRARLFEPFFTTRKEGAGLGLAIARKIVDLHGGSIDASNAPEGGARFVVKIPAGETAS